MTQPAPPPPAATAAADADEKNARRSPTAETPRGAAKAADDDELTIVPDSGSSETDPEKTPAARAPATAPEADVAPDGGYGWVVVGCVFMINAHTWGINSVCPRKKTAQRHG